MVIRNKLTGDALAKWASCQSVVYAFERSQNGKWKQLSVTLGGKQPVYVVYMFEERHATRNEIARTDDAATAVYTYQAL